MDLEYLHSFLSPYLELCMNVSAIELVKELMDYEVGQQLLSGLVGLLRPAKEDLIQKIDLLEGRELLFFVK